MILDDFIEKANKKHNQKYDYSISQFKNWKTNIDIICKVHGTFSQNPGTHLSRSGCPSCSNVKRYTKDSFIEKANLIHNNKYDYSKVSIINYKTKITIICDIHGIFEQLLHNHISGRGCPGCAMVKKITLDDFIKRSNVIHSDKYLYNKIISIENNDSYGIITCKKHGDFNQRISSHLEGYGCKSCAMNCKSSKVENEWLDSLNIDEKYRQYKIGRYIVDGFDCVSNTIYEFNGDFWHGNPNLYKSDDLNSMLGKTFGELYLSTLDKKNNLQLLGYNVISIWESDYKKTLK